MDYSIKINEFEGPLDLLLHLIKQSNISINETYQLLVDTYQLNNYGVFGTLIAGIIDGYLRPLGCNK